MYVSICGGPPGPHLAGAAAGLGLVHQSVACMGRAELTNLVDKGALLDLDMTDSSARAELWTPVLALIKTLDSQTLKLYLGQSIPGFICVC